jgi:hypothetical protein
VRLHTWLLQLFFERDTVRIDDPRVGSIGLLPMDLCGANWQKVTAGMNVVVQNTTQSDHRKLQRHGTISVNRARSGGSGVRRIPPPSLQMEIVLSIERTKAEVSDSARFRSDKLFS